MIRITTEAKRIEWARRFESLCRDNPDTPKRVLAARIADAAGVSVRTVWLWVQRGSEPKSAG